jgi:hypothetical protein
MLMQLLWLLLVESAGRAAVVAWPKLMQLLLPLLANK